MKLFFNSEVLLWFWNRYFLQVIAASLDASIGREHFRVALHVVKPRITDDLLQVYKKFQQVNQRWSTKCCYKIFCILSEMWNTQYLGLQTCIFIFNLTSVFVFLIKLCKLKILIGWDWLAPDTPKVPGRPSNFFQRSLLF